jgi:molybdate transport system substrate-binding protein
MWTLWLTLSNQKSARARKLTDSGNTTPLILDRLYPAAFFNRSPGLITGTRLSNRRAGLYHWRMLIKLLFVLLSSLLLQFAAHAGQSPRIAAASSLQFALPEIVAAFQRKTGVAARVTYGSSGNFRRQIAQGAPFELFLSADEQYVDDLIKLGLTAGPGRVYALGRIAVILPQGSDIELSQDLAGLRSAIDTGHLKHFAIANPDHAPYGRAARQALESLGLWQSIQPRLIKGENASQATQFAISGSSQGGIVPYSLAISPAIARISTNMPIPESSHQPIRHRMVLLQGAGEFSRQFFEFLGEAESIAIFMNNGYGVTPR